MIPDLFPKIKAGRMYPVDTGPVSEITGYVAGIEQFLS